MKIWVISLGLLLSCMTALAQGNWSPYDESRVPDQVKKHVKELHPSASSLHWGVRYKGRVKLFHATGMENEHHFSMKILEDGTDYGRIYSVGHHEAAEPVKAEIDKLLKDGWKLDKLYHRIIKHRNIEEYKAFFTKDNNGKMSHLHIEWDKNGKKLQKRKTAHSQHHVHN